MVAGRFIEGCWLTFGVVALAFAGLWLKSRREERLLSEHLRDAYAGYRARVRSALIPSVL